MASTRRFTTADYAAAMQRLQGNQELLRYLTSPLSAPQPQEPKPEERGVWGPGLSAGVDNLQSLGYSGAAAVADAVGWDGGRDFLNNRAKVNQEEAAANGRPDLQRIEDQTLETMPDFVQYQIAQQLPTLAAVGLTMATPIPGDEAVALSAAGRGLSQLGKAFGGGGLKQGMSFAERRAALERGQDAAKSLYRGTVGMYPFGVGSLYQESVDGNDPSPYAALAGGVPYAASEVLVPGAVKNLLVPGGGAFTGNIASRVGKAAGLGALGEAGTETFQNEMEMAYNDTLSPEEIASRRLNAPVVGAIVGGPLGGPGGIRRGYTDEEIAAAQEKSRLDAQAKLDADRQARQQEIADSIAQQQQYQQELENDHQAKLGFVQQFGWAFQGDAPLLPSEFAAGVKERTPKAQTYDDYVLANGPYQGGEDQWKKDNPKPKKPNVPALYDEYRKIWDTGAVQQPSLEEPTHGVDPQQLGFDFEGTGNTDPRAQLFDHETAQTRGLGLDNQAQIDRMDLGYGRGVAQLPLLPTLDQQSLMDRQAAAFENQQGGISGYRGRLNTDVGSFTNIVPNRDFPAVNQRAQREYGATDQTTEDFQREQGIPAPKPWVPPAAQTTASPAKTATPKQPAGTATPKQAKPEVPAEPAAPKQPSVKQAVRNEVDAALASGVITEEDHAGLTNTIDQSSASPAVVANKVRKELEEITKETPEQAWDAMSEVPWANVVQSVRDKWVGTPAQQRTAERIDALVAENNKVAPTEILDGLKSETFRGRKKDQGKYLDAFLQGDKFKDIGGSQEERQKASQGVKRALASLKAKAQEWVAAGKITEAQAEQALRAINDDYELSVGAGMTERQREIAELTGGIVDNETLAFEDAAQHGALVRAASTSAGVKLDNEGSFDDAIVDTEQSGPSETSGTELPPGMNTGVEEDTDGENKATFQAAFNEAVKKGMSDAEAAHYARKLVETLDDVTVPSSEGGQNAVSKNAQRLREQQVAKQVNEKQAAKDKARRDTYRQTAQNWWDEYNDQYGNFDDLPTEIQNKWIDLVARAHDENAGITASKLESAQDSYAKDAEISGKIEASEGSPGETEIGTTEVGTPGRDDKGAPKTGTPAGQRAGQAQAAEGVSKPAKKQAKKQPEPTWDDDVDTYGEEIYDGESEDREIGAEADVPEKPVKSEEERVVAALSKAANSRNPYKKRDAKAMLDRIRTIASDPAAAKELLAEAKALLVKHGRKFSVGGASQGQSVATLKAKLLKAFNSPYFFDRSVVVVQNESDPRLPEADRESLSQTPGKVQGFYDPETKKVYLIAGNIAQGKELAVLLHEAGVHMGMKNLLGQANYDKLIKQLEMWEIDAFSGDTTQEAKLIAKARERVEKAKAKIAKMGEKPLTQAQEMEELLAYFVEEAVLAGVNPSAIKGSGKLQQWFRTFMKAVNAALARLGIAPDKLTSQHVVDLAYGAAAMEVTGQSETAQTGKGTMFSIADSIPVPIANRWTDLTGKMETLSPKLLTNWQLVDQYGDVLTTLGTHQNIVDRMTQMQQRLVRRSHDVLEKWSTLAFKAKETAKRTNQIMHDATLYGVHPDEGFGKGGNAHLTANDRAKYDELKARYNALPQQAKDIYQDAKKLLADNWELRKQVYADVVNAAYAPEIEAAGKDSGKVAKIKDAINREVAAHNKQINEIKGPYFPLMRFGDYLVIAQSDELLDKRAQLEKASGEQYKKLAAEVASMEANPAHYQAHAFERKSEQVAKATELRAKGMKARETKGEEFSKQTQSVSFAAADRLRNTLSNRFDSDTASKLTQVVTQMALAATPEHSALRRQLKRKGVHGASTDMMRAFADTMESDSFHLSRMSAMKDMGSNLFQMKKEAGQSGTKYMDVYNNLVKRMEVDFTFARSPVAAALTRLSSIWHLGIAPSYLLTNMTQPFMITSGHLAGAFGMRRSMGALASAWADSTKIIKAGKKGHMMAEVDFTQGLVGEELELAQHLLDLGKLEIANNIDTEVYATGAHPAFIKGIKMFNWANHNIELVNRLTTALATFRLERARGDKQRAFDKAREAIELTQLSYDEANKAYFMKSAHLGGWNRVPMQFKSYQQGMLYLLFRNLKNSGADPESRKALVYLMGMQLAVAGVRGLPIAAPLMLLASLGGDDDDEKGDVETQARNYLTDLLGADAARAAWKGLPTMLGADLSGNVGMGNLLNPLGYLKLKDVTGASTGEGAVSKVLTSAAGAPVGMLTRWVDATQAAGRGDFRKAAEKALPKFLASPVKAAGMASEGITTSRGNQAINPNEFDVWDLAYQAAGFQPVKKGEYYDAVQSKEDTAHAIKQRKREIVSKALRGEDVAKDMKEFRADHPKDGFNYSDVRRAVVQQRKDKNLRSSTGVRFANGEKYLKGIDRFAEMEPEEETVDE